MRRMISELGGEGANEFLLGIVLRYTLIFRKIKYQCGGKKKTELCNTIAQEIEINISVEKTMPDREKYQKQDWT